MHLYYNILHKLPTYLIIKSVDAKLETTTNVLNRYFVSTYIILINLFVAELVLR